MGKFEVNRDKKGDFRFNLLATNGQVILRSEGYSAKSSCLNGIESVCKNSQEDKRYERSESDAGHRFNLISNNGQIIGTSETYSSVAAMENGIESIKTNAPEATVEDNV